MRLKLKYIATFRYVTGKRSEELEVKDSFKLADLLDLLVKRYGEKFRELVFDKDGGLNEYSMVLVNGKVVNQEKLKLNLKDGDTVCFLPFVDGG